MEPTSFYPTFRSSNIRVLAPFPTLPAGVGPVCPCARVRPRSHQLVTVVLPLSGRVTYHRLACPSRAYTPTLPPPDPAPQRDTPRPPGSPGGGFPGTAPVESRRENRNSSSSTRCVRRSATTSSGATISPTTRSSDTTGWTSRRWRSTGRRRPTRRRSTCSSRTSRRHSRPTSRDRPTTLRERPTPPGDGTPTAGPLGRPSRTGTTDRRVWPPSAAMALNLLPTSPPT